MGEPGLLDRLSEQYVKLHCTFLEADSMLTGITESSDIPAAPQVARKPHTTGGSGAIGSTNGITNGNHSGVGGVAKNVDFAPATSATGGVNTVSY